MTAEGWELAFVTSGVESDAGKQDGDGILLPATFLEKEIIDFFNFFKAVL
jgi:hypothetical protein